MRFTHHRTGASASRPGATLALLLVVLLVVGGGAVGLVLSGGDQARRAAASTPTSPAGTTSADPSPAATDESAPSDAASPSGDTGQRDGEQDGTQSGTPDGKKDDTKDDGTVAQQPGKPGTGRTVEVEEVPVEEPVDLDDSTRLGSALEVGLVDLRGVQAEAKAPGEISGPGVLLGVEVRNASGRAVDLSTIVVFVSYGPDRTPASQIGTGSTPLTGELAPGARAGGEYVYLVPPEARGDLRIEVSRPGDPTVVFAGALDG